jgi:hypothetical protein
MEGVDRGDSSICAQPCSLSHTQILSALVMDRKENNAPGRPAPTVAVPAPHTREERSIRVRASFPIRGNMQVGALEVFQIRKIIFDQKACPACMRVRRDDVASRPGLCKISTIL